jgi:imidazolonepropionase-like amidohydrolase
MRHGRRLKIASILFLVLPTLLPGQTGKPLAFTHAVIIDGVGGPPIEDGTLIVRGDKIEAVGPVGDVQIPGDAEIIDLGGKVLMPGLADMHVHLVGGWDGETVDILGYRRYLNALLYAGVTTVLDTGNMKPFVIQMREEIAAGRLPGPRIYCAGPLIDGPDPAWPPISLSVCSVEQIPKLVRQLKQDRVDVLKAYIGLSVPMVWALAAEGRKNGLPVFVDQTWRNGSPELAAGGITAFVHTPDFIFGQEALGILKQRGTMFVSTLAVVEAKSWRRMDDLAFLENPLVRDTTPPFILEDLLAEARRRKGSAEWNGGPRQQDLQRFERQMANLKKLVDAGLMFAAGTDAAYPGVFQGEGLHHELELLVEAGLSPLAALSMATQNAAKLMNAESEWGSLKPGRRADLIVVRGRPDRRIGDTKNIEMVIQLGKVLDRAQLKYDAASDPGFRPVSPVSAAK